MLRTTLASSRALRVGVLGLVTVTTAILIRLIFDQPKSIKHIFLQFDELEHSRTQEFVLLWRAENEDFFREILRQQYHFSPPLTTQEIEIYTVDLKHLKALELRIIPNISDGEARAKLTRLRLSAI